MGMRKVLICGDRDWSDKESIREILKKFPPDTTLIHGNARGADKLAGEVAKEIGYSDEQIDVYPADWNKYGNPAGPIRNRQMLKEGKPNYVIAFHDNIELSKGTKDMVTISKKANLPTLIMNHKQKDGKIGVKKC